VPQAVIAEISSRRRIVGTIGLRAIGAAIVTAGRRRHNRDRAAVIVILVIGITRGIGRPAIIAVALRRDGAADQRTGDRSGNEAAAAAMVTAAMPAAAISATEISANTNARTACVETSAPCYARPAAMRMLGEACGRRHHRQH
jgi:hypothetical protein